MTETYTPFDFMSAASYTKKDIISDSEQPEEIEKQYNPYMVNRGFSFHLDAILHANEMNRLWHLPKDAQFTYYMSALKSRNRTSKWPKAEKSTDLDNIQQTYQCNRNVAKEYLKLLSSENLQAINTIMDKGGATSPKTK